MVSRFVPLVALASILLLTGCNGGSIEYLLARASYLLSSPTSQSPTVLTSTPAPTQLAILQDETSIPPKTTGKTAQAIETPLSNFPPGELLIEQYNPPRVVLSSTDGKRQQQVLDFAPAKVSISPDGLRLAYLSNGVVSILDLVSQQTTRFNYETSGNLPFDNIAWSPDGTQIAFGCYSEITKTLELCLLNISTGARQEGSNYLKLGLKSNPDLDGAFTGNWSADGSQIVFVTRTTPGNGVNAWGIVQIYRPYDGTIQTVIDERKASGLKNLTSPSISPDGKIILFQAKSGDQTAIYRIQSDGSKLERLTAEGFSFDISNPMWDPTGRYFVAQAQDLRVQKIKTVSTIFSFDGELLYQFDMEGFVKSWIGISK